MAKTIVRTACSFCGKNFELTLSRYNSHERHFCSKPCVNKGRTKNVRKKDPSRWITLICLCCEKPFSRYKTAVRGDFCSHTCYWAWRKENTPKGIENTQYCRIKQPCDLCGIPKLITASRLKIYKHHFCSKSCKFIFLASLLSGKNNPRWRGGKSYRGEEWPLVRQQALKRQPYCSVCATTKYLDIHHIVPFRVSKSNQQQNLVSLCRKHHSIVERITDKLSDSQLLSISILELIDFVNTALSEKGIGTIQLPNCQCSFF